MNYTTEELLESLQNDLETIKTNLSEGEMEIDEDDNFSNISTKTTGIVIGGSPTPHNINELNDMTMDLLHNFVEGLKENPQSYTTRTTDNITLYTPNSDYQYYIVQKRSSGKYRVAWTIEPAFYWNNAIYPICIGWNASEARTTPVISTLDVDIFRSTEVTTIGNYYVSPEYSTLEECVTKFLSNNISYTYLRNNFLGALADSPYIVPYTNCTILKADGTIGESQRLSSNETIETR